MEDAGSDEESDQHSDQVAADGVSNPVRSIVPRLNMVGMGRRKAHFHPYRQNRQAAATLACALSPDGKAGLVTSSRMGSDRSATDCLRGLGRQKIFFSPSETKTVRRLRERGGGDATTTDRNSMHSESEAVGKKGQSERGRNDGQTEVRE